MSKEIYRIEIPIETKDDYSKGIEQAKKGVESLEKSAENAGKELSDLEKSAGKTGKESEKLGRSADKAGKDVDKLGTSSKGAAKGVEQVGGSSGRSEKQVSRFQRVVQRSHRVLQRMTGRRWQINLRAVDRASRVIRSVGRFASRVTERTYRTTIRALNMAGGVIRGVRRSLLSLPSMITIGLGIVGVGKLSGATVGSAMNFEDYGVSMDHWLDGDQKASDQLMEWMGRKADTTPFTSVDIFPAMTGAVNIAGNNMEEIKRLTSAAIDMASLTPGSTVEDAMQAIHNARMGEMTMMKRFGFNITKADYDSMGWEGFVDEIEKRFEGGALALSETARGQLNTLKGYMQSQFRSMGEGILEPMKPRLEGITRWLMDNEDKWGAWKNTVENAGRQASEWVFSKLETGFKHLRDNYLENEEFHKLNFEGKISFIMDDINRWWSNNGKPAISSWWNSTGQPMAEDLGTLMGKAMVKGVILAVKGGISTAFGMWSNTWDTAKEHGIFSKETGRSVVGSMGGTALLAGAGSLILHPVIKAAKGIFRSGGALLRGGKNIFTKATGRGGRTPSTPVPAQPGKSKGFRMPKLPKGLSKLADIGKRIPVLGTLLGGAALITAPKEEKAGAVGGIAGAASGSALGSVVPGIGNVVGGLVGGLAGAFGGEKAFDWIYKNFDKIKSVASDTGAWIGDKFSSGVGIVKDAWGDIGSWFSDTVWGPVKTGASSVGDFFGGMKDTISETLFSGGWWKGKWDDVKGWTSETLSDTSEWWNGIKQTASETIFSANWWFEQAGFVYGYLESTIFSGGWWIDKWETVKDWTEGTIFDGSWWMERWGSVMDWTSEKWESAIEIWESVKTSFAETVFSSDWWLGKWDNVKGWTQEKWDSAVVIWESVRTAFAETVFSADWWLGKWDLVKGWTQEKWDSAVTIWDSIKDKINETLFSSEWWMGKWESVKGWTQSKWDTFTSVWDSAKQKINESLFNKGWWSGKWQTVKGWAESAWDGIKGMASDLGDSFNKGRQKGQGSTANKTARNHGTISVARRTKVSPTYASGTNYHPGGPAIVGDGGGSELVQFPSGRTWLSPATDTLVDLPRGTKVLPHQETTKVLDRTRSNVIPFPIERTSQQSNRYIQQYNVPKYAEGIGKIDFDPVEYPSSSGSGSTVVYSGTHNEIGDTHVTVVVNASDVDTNDPDALAHQIADKVAGIVADKVEQVSSNMPAV